MTNRFLAVACWWSTFVAGLLVAAPIVRATTLVPMSLAEMARDAMSIARGRVTAIETRAAADRHSVETIVTLDVEIWLKGGSGTSVEFAVPGGLLGRYRTIVIGSPRFAVDDHVVVFLTGSGPALPHVVGFSQGVYHIVVPPASTVGTGQPQVVGAGMGAPAPDETGKATMPLQTFEERVRVLGRGQR